MLYKCIPHAPAEAGGGTVVRRGGRSLVVDIHCHLLAPAAVTLLGELLPGEAIPAAVEGNPLTAEVNRRQNETIRPMLTEPEVRIADMDRLGVDIQAISPAPFHFNYHLPADAVRQSCRLVNDRIAEVVGAHPDRFVGMGTVPLQDPQMATAELERCVRGLGLRGIEISTHVRGRELSRSGLEPFFARAEELGIVLFMHPIGTSIAERMSDHYFRNLIGHPLESALAIGHLVFDGTLARYPGLKICVAHGGGYAACYPGRFDHPWHRRDDCRVHIDKPPSEYIKRLYFDTVVFTDHQLRYLVETWGADHVIMGTDYPYDMAEPDPVGFVRGAGLGEAAEARVLGLNAAELLGIEAPQRAG